MRSLITIMAVMVAVGFGTESSAEVCKDAVALRVNSSGLAFIAEQVKVLLPSKIDLPAARKTVVDWPLTSEDAEVEIDALSVALKLKNLHLTMLDGALRIRGSADVVGAVEPTGSHGDRKDGAGRGRQHVEGAEFEDVGIADARPHGGLLAADAQSSGGDVGGIDAGTL